MLHSVAACCEEVSLRCWLSMAFVCMIYFSVLYGTSDVRFGSIFVRRLCKFLFFFVIQNCVLSLFCLVRINKWMASFWRGNLRWRLCETAERDGCSQEKRRIIIVWRGIIFWRRRGRQEREAKGSREEGDKGSVRFRDLCDYLLVDGSMLSLLFK